MSPAAVAIIIALAAPVGAYLVAARRFSGKIKTSEAEELWAESRAIRQDSAERIKILNGIVERLEIRINSLEADNERLLRYIAELTNGRSTNVP